MKCSDRSGYLVLGWGYDSRGGGLNIWNLGQTQSITILSGFQYFNALE